MLFLPRTSHTVPGHRNGQLDGCTVSTQVLPQTAAWPSHSSRKQSPHLIEHVCSSPWEASRQPSKLAHLLSTQLLQTSVQAVWPLPSSISICSSCFWSIPSRNRSGLHPPSLLPPLGTALLRTSTRPLLLAAGKRIICQH